MKIGLVDVDSHNFPNIPLMKLAAWHREQGDSVEWAIPMLPYDKVYMSKVFTFTPDYEANIVCDELVKGGTGYDLENKLPPEIESIYPDYSLYNETKAYGFLTRGCPRGCPFCIVAQKEGRKSYQVAELGQFWKDQKEIVLCDPNLLACDNHLELLQQLADSKAWVEVNQGFDIRLMTEDAIEKIRQIKIKMVHFAWDRGKDSALIIQNLTAFKKATNINHRRAVVYVLVNFETDFEFDLYRIYKLKELGFDPYVMIYDKVNAPHEIKRLARWVNNRFVFRSCERFEDYK